MFVWTSIDSEADGGFAALARAFGSWLEAPQAAGVTSEGCRRADVIARVRDIKAARRSTSRAQQRASILAGVQRCAEMLGRFPRVSEYVAWRRRFAPETPSHATVYRTFPRVGHPCCGPGLRWG